MKCLQWASWVLVASVVSCGGSESANEPTSDASVIDVENLNPPFDTSTTDTEIADGATTESGPVTGGECVTPPVGATDPKLPTARVDTTWVVPKGKTINVAAGGDLQKAIDDAVPGDEIALDAGATFTGNFKLPAKKGDDWIVIRSSALASLPKEGARVAPTDAPKMPKLVTKAALSVISTAAQAHHYRLVGLELTAADGVDVDDLIVFGSGSAKTIAEQPHHLVIDRCFIHGDPKKGGKRGVQLNSASTAVIGSYVSDWKRVGQDTQAILGWNGPGPFKLVNNYLEGAGENVMFGGADPAIPDLIPSDIEICGNLFSKPARWHVGDPSYEGTHWSVKNLFELKIARRVLIAGNVFENCWTDAQTGFAIVIKTANQDGTTTWAITEEVTFAYNVIAHANNGVAISPRDTDKSNKTRGVRLYNDLIHSLGEPAMGGDGRIYQVLGVERVTIEHDTAFGKSNAVVFDGGPSPSFVFRNNLIGPTTYGVKGSGTGSGTSALAMFGPSAVFEANVIVGATEKDYPPKNFFPATLLEVGFVDTAKSDFRLSPASKYGKAATDGKAIGADLDALFGATGPYVVK